MSVRRIRVNGQMLNAFLRGSPLWKETLPLDANVIGMLGEDRGAQCFVLLVESKKFLPVGEGQLIPFIEPTLIATTNKRVFFE
jgi:hypothetical protein